MLELWVDTARTSTTCIRGEVRGRLDRPARCEGVSVALVQHTTYARGFRDWSQPAAQLQVAADETWPANQDVCVPFEFAGAVFTPTYRGGLLSVAWSVDANVKLADAAPLALSEPLSLGLGADDALAITAPPIDRAAVARASRRGVGIAAGVAAGPLALAVAGYATGAWWMWLGIAATAVALFAVLGLTIQWQNETKVGNLQLEFTPDARCVLWSLPGAPPLAVAVELIAEEVVYSHVRSQADRKKYTDVVFRHELELTASEPGCYSAPLPDLRALDVPCTMKNGMDSGVQWRAAAVATARGIHVQRDVELEVRPARRSNG